MADLDLARQMECITQQCPRRKDNDRPLSGLYHNGLWGAMPLALAMGM